MNRNIIILLLFPLVVFSQEQENCRDLFIKKAPDSTLDRNILTFISQNGSVSAESLLDNKDISRYPQEFIYQLYNIEKVISGFSIENTPIGIDNVYLINYKDNESLNYTIDRIKKSVLEDNGEFGDYDLFPYFKRRLIFFVNNKENCLTIFVYNPFGADLLNKQVDHFINRNKENFDQIIDAGVFYWRIIE